MASHPAAPIELDRCGNCGSAWFDAGELRAHLAERLQRPHLRVSLGRGGSPGSHLCPRCFGRHLWQRRIHQVPVHVCSECRGVLIAGEQVQVIAQGLASNRSFFDAPVWSIIEAIGELFLEIGS